MSPFNNFTFDNSNVQDICAALKAIDDEYGAMISKGYTGDNWEATWISGSRSARPQAWTP